MDEKERKELIETIKTRVEVWDDQEWNFPGSGATMVELTNGNKFYIDKLRIEQHDVHEDVMVSLYDDLIGETECYLQHLTDESLEKIALELPLTYTIFVEFFTDYKHSYNLLTQPVRANYGKEDFADWLSKNFPLLDWEPYDNDYICYTEFTDGTGPYLYATLHAGE